VRRQLTLLAGPLLAAALVAAALRSNGSELIAALEELPLAVFACACGLHLGSLLLRVEAWRESLAAVTGTPLPRAELHGASAAAFLAGSLASHLTMPARIALLRRLAPSRCPRATHVVVADAPILVLEVCFATGFLAIAAGSLPGLPWWTAPLALLLAIGLLVGLRALDKGPLAAGLRVLASPGGRARLAALVAGLSVLSALRIWLLLLALGLPHGLSDVAVLFALLGLFGLLPIGLAASPAAALAVHGGRDLAAAAAAGMLISATAVAAVLVYALLVATGVVAERLGAGAGRAERTW
jgi:hypothetical protein